MTTRTMSLRSRSPSGEPVTVLRDDWDNAMIAVVICDMWDTTHCVSAAQRVEEMAPRMDQVVRKLRRKGSLIVHAPWGCMDYYRGTPARKRAQQAVPVGPPAPNDWNAWNPAFEAELPGTLLHPGACSCDSAVPCNDGYEEYPWTRQIQSIEVAADDAVTDDGTEFFALLEQGGVDDIIVMGVHANVCVLGRPYGIRQLVYLGKTPLLCRASSSCNTSSRTN
jgi:nicotinamidase-related amidase